MNNQNNNIISQQNYNINNQYDYFNSNNHQNYQQNINNFNYNEEYFDKSNSIQNYNNFIDEASLDNQNNISSEKKAKTSYYINNNYTKYYDENYNNDIIYNDIYGQNKNNDNLFEIDNIKDNQNGMSYNNENFNYDYNSNNNDINNIENYQNFYDNNNENYINDYNENNNDIYKKEKYQNFGNNNNENNIYDYNINNNDINKIDNQIYWNNNSQNYFYEYNKNNDSNKIENNQNFDNKNNENYFYDNNKNNNAITYENNNNNISQINIKDKQNSDNNINENIFNKFGDFNLNNKNNNNSNNIINNSSDNDQRINKDTSEKEKTILEPSTPKIELNFMVRARGLANVGATCYMNATLQCFYHVKRLSENLINDKEITPSMEMTYSYKNLIEELTNCKNKKKYIISAENYIFDEKKKDYYEPNEFKDLISRKNPLFKGIQANDSKDLIIFLLENMDTELTERNNKNAPKEIFDGKNIEYLTEQNFKKIHNSIFAETFYGFQKSIMKCCSCNHKDETYNVFNFLIFPLEKIYNCLNQNNKNLKNIMIYNNLYNNYMNNNMYNNMYNMNNNMYNNMYNMNNNMNNYIYNYMNNNIYPFLFNNSLNNMNLINSKQFKFPTSVTPSPKLNLNYIFNNNNDIPRKLTLDDCFKENESFELLSGSNQIFCNNCRQSSNAETKNEIHKAPNVLILILNRGRGNTFTCEVDFPHQLDISQYVKGPSSPKNYELIGVISHLGKSSMEGHFIAYCKHFDFNWYLFNDGIVNQVPPDEIYKGVPYILFYQNINFN